MITHDHSLNTFLMILLLYFVEQWSRQRTNALGRSKRSRADGKLKKYAYKIMPKHFLNILDFIRSLRDNGMFRVCTDKLQCLQI